MSSDKCRESFEAWFSDVPLVRDGDGYRFSVAQSAWCAWTASREELAKEQKKDGIRLVKFVDGGTLEPRKFECEGDDDAE